MFAFIRDTDQLLVSRVCGKFKSRNSNYPPHCPRSWVISEVWRNHHHPVEYGDAEERDEADAPRQIEVDATQPERRDAAARASGTMHRIRNICRALWKVA
jgi:hypothetical protein